MIEICKSQGKENGGPWKCYDVYNFFGWEAQRVVVAGCDNWRQHPRDGDKSQDRTIPVACGAEEGRI